MRRSRSDLSPFQLYIDSWVTHFWGREGEAAVKTMLLMRYYYYTTKSIIMIMIIIEVKQDHSSRTTIQDKRAQRLWGGSQFSNMY